MRRTAIKTFRTGKLIPIQKWLDELEKNEPRAFRKCLQRVLLLAEKGFMLEMPFSKPLRDGISELRAQVGTVNYRILYFFCKNAACLSHGLTKEAKVPPDDIELAISRKALIEQDDERYTAEWDAPNG